MAEGAVRHDGFFSHGIDAITHRGLPVDPELPELPGLQRLPTPHWQRPPALEQLLAGHALDGRIDAAIRPMVSEPEWLLPQSFSRILAQARETLQRAGERHGYPTVLVRAEQALAQEHEWRELARTYRDALYAA